ncbi:hypothetical protein XU19_21280 [Vibrio parahaemolyticus]|nr:hypothetical protein XU19_21280 [Vibrio parahaemolyticus]KKY44577.1 hypothetical protein AAY51_02700 [Vibrio parahaemolyticus]KOP99161.1 hypothetical protein AL012_02690 [Citrobacter amalonaticus]KOQ00327.1 hypothetical protein ALC61_03220 [Citrobacter amalonaticus]
MTNPDHLKLPTVKQLIAVAKERNIPLTDKQAKVLLKRWKVDIERESIPGSAIQGNMEIFARYVQPGFVVKNSFTKTAYSVPRRRKKGDV